LKFIRFSLNIHHYGDYLQVKDFSAVPKILGAIQISSLSTTLSAFEFFDAQCVRMMQSHASFSSPGPPAHQALGLFYGTLPQKGEEKAVLIEFSSRSTPDDIEYASKLSAGIESKFTCNLSSRLVSYYYLILL
jgi:hypothetical protein